MRQQSTAVVAVARVLWTWGPPVTLMVAIFLSSAQSDLGLPAGPLDKYLHFASFAVLAGLYLRALAGAEWIAMTPRLAVVAIVLAALYGATDEWHQRFVPGRNPDLADLAADAAGAAIGAIVALILARLALVVAKSDPEANPGREV